MWSANIKSVDKIHGTVRILVAFNHVNGVDKKEEYLFPDGSSDETWLKARVQERIDALTNLYTFADSLVVGAIDTTIEKEEQSQEQKDFIAFREQYDILLGMKAAIEAGLKKETDEDFVAQQAIVKEAFKPEYAARI